MTDPAERLLSGCPPGWHGILRDLIRQLAQQDPGCEIRYAREKFGMLDVMLNSGRPELWDLVRDASDRSAVTCERCGGGEGSRFARPSGWLKTLCLSCAADIAGYEPLGETVQSPEGRRWGVWQVSTAGGVEHYLDLISGRYSHSGEESSTRELVAVEVQPSVGGSMRLRLDGGETVTVEGIERIERIR